MSLALGVLLRVHQQFAMFLSFTGFIPQASVSFPVEFSQWAAGQGFSLKENISCSLSCCGFIFKVSAVAVGYKTSWYVASTVSQCWGKVRWTRNLLRTSTL